MSKSFTDKKNVLVFGQIRTDKENRGHIWRKLQLFFGVFSLLREKNYAVQL